MIPFIAKALIPLAIILIPIYSGLKIFSHLNSKNHKDEIDIEPFDEFV